MTAWNRWTSGPKQYGSEATASQPVTSSIVPALRSLYVDRRHQALVVAAVVVGIGTGLLVAAFDKITAGILLEHLFRAPLAVQVVVPVVGLAIAALSLRWIAGGANPATADAYVQNFHDRSHPLPQRPVAGRIIASIATLGSGGAMGFEGPSIYLGAAFGSAVQTRIRRFLRADETKSLLVAGAAGGVAAIFKAPATGVLFALESPYQDDIARHGLIPALVAAATSYLTYVALLGTRPLFNLTTAGAGFGGVDLFGAAIVGLAAGFGARGFAWVMHHAKHTATVMPVVARVALFGAGSAGLALLSHHLYGDTLTIGPGYRTFHWISDPHRAIWLIALLFLLRLLATGCTVAGGGAGGMFIPLVIEGAILGRLIAAVFDAAGWHAGGNPEAATSLFIILGIAAFLGAGYRTPLAGVMFVAETTGKAVFVVPGLIAAAVAQLLMARASVSTAQLSKRTGYLEGRFELPLSSAILTDVLTVPSDTTVAEFVSNLVVLHRQRAAAVLDDGRYLGYCVLRDAASVPRDEWENTLVTDVLREGVPSAQVDWRLREALAAMDRVDMDRLAVLDDAGAFIGEIRRSEIFKLDELLDDAGN